MRQLQKGGGFLNVRRVQLNAHVASAKAGTHHSDRPGAEEWIQNKISGSGGRKNARFDKRLGKSSNVGTGRVHGVDIPDGSSVAHLPACRQLAHGICIISIILRLCEHEQVFVGSGRTILNALWHGVRFVPNNIAPQIPPDVLKRKREPPGNPQQIFILESRGVVRTRIHRPVRVFFIRRPPSTVPAGVSVTDVEPKNTIRSENALHFGKNSGQRLQETRQCRFEPDLSRNPVIPQSPVWRRRDHTLHGLGRKSAKREMHIPFDDR